MRPPSQRRARNWSSPPKSNQKRRKNKSVAPARAVTKSDRNWHFVRDRGASGPRTESRYARDPVLDTLLLFQVQDAKPRQGKQGDIEQESFEDSFVVDENNQVQDIRELFFNDDLDNSVVEGDTDGDIEVLDVTVSIINETKNALAADNENALDPVQNPFDDEEEFSVDAEDEDVVEDNQEVVVGGNEENVTIDAEKKENIQLGKEKEQKGNPKEEKKKFIAKNKGKSEKAVSEKEETQAGPVEEENELNLIEDRNRTESVEVKKWGDFDKETETNQITQEKTASKENIKEEKETDVNNDDDIFVKQVTLIVDDIKKNAEEAGQENEAKNIFEQELVENLIEEDRNNVFPNNIREILRNFSFPDRFVQENYATGPRDVLSIKFDDEDIDKIQDEDPTVTSEIPFKDKYADIENEISNDISIDIDTESEKLLDGKRIV